MVRVGTFSCSRKAVNHPFDDPHAYLCGCLCGCLSEGVMCSCVGMHVCVRAVNCPSEDARVLVPV